MTFVGKSCIATLIFAAAFAAALWPQHPAGATDVVVLDARGINLKPGQAIDGAQKLVLTSGQQVTLISPTGKTLKLRGPYEEAPLGTSADSAPDVAAAITAMVTQNLARSSKVGVVRGAGDDVVPPEPWLIDVTHNGTRCLVEGSPVVFWRPGAGPSARLQVAPSDRSWRARADWPAGIDRLTMPPALPLHGRSSYVVNLGDKDVPITLVTVPSAASNDAMRAAFMMDAGCETQAQALLKQATR